MDRLDWIEQPLNSEPIIMLNRKMETCRIYSFNFTSVSDETKTKFKRNLCAS